MSKYRNTLNLLRALLTDSLLHNGDTQIVIEMQPNRNRGKIVFNAEGFEFEGIMREFSSEVDRNYTVVIEGRLKENMEFNIKSEEDD